MSRTARGLVILAVLAGAAAMIGYGFDALGKHLPDPPIGGTAEYLNDGERAAVWIAAAVMIVVVAYAIGAWPKDDDE